MTVRSITPYIEFLVMIGLVLLFAVAAYQRNFVWEDDFSLWQDVVNKSVHKPRGHNNLGTVLSDKGLVAEAIAEYETSILLKSCQIEPRVNLASSYSTIGMTDKAIAEFKQILILVPGNPHIHYNLGLAYSSKGLYDEAIKEFKETLRLNSYDHDARQRFERIGKLIQQPSK